MNCDIMMDLETLSTRTDAVVLSVAGVAFNFHELPQEPKKRSIIQRIKQSPHFYFSLIDTVDEQVELGRHKSKSTINWWKQQNETAIANTFTNKDCVRITTENYSYTFPKEYDECTMNTGWIDISKEKNIRGLSFNSIETFFMTLDNFLNEHKIRAWWGNGAVFDLAILNHFRESWQDKTGNRLWRFPISYRDNYDYRTIYRMSQKLFDYEHKPMPDDMIEHNSLHDAALQVLSLEEMLRLIYK